MKKLFFVFFLIFCLFFPTLSLAVKCNSCEEYEEYELPEDYNFEPEYFIVYCKPECSNKTKMFGNVYKRLYCYDPVKVPYNFYKHYRIALRQANHYGLDPLYFLVQIECESCWNPNAKSPDGGYGLTQVTPRVLGNMEIDMEQILDPEYNCRLGARIKVNSYKIARKILQDLGIENPSNKCVADVALRVYNGGTKYLKYELQYIKDELKKNPCSFPLQSVVCARDKCLWRVNIVYVIRVHKMSDKYRKILNTK